MDEFGLNCHHNMVINARLHTAQMMIRCDSIRVISFEVDVLTVDKPRTILIISGFRLAYYIVCWNLIGLN